jgi:hypothetical protein
VISICGSINLTVIVLKEKFQLKMLMEYLWKIKKNTGQHDSNDFKYESYWKECSSNISKGNDYEIHMHTQIGSI